MVEIKSFQGYEKYLDSWIAQSIELMTKFIREERSGDDSGQTKLTALSNALGQIVLKDISNTGVVSTPVSLNIGDSILGVFLSLGYIDILRDPEDSSDYAANTAPYYVRPLDNFEELTASKLYLETPTLSGTSLEPIEDISQVFQKNNRKVIKQFSDEQERECVESIGRGDPWVKAADTLQQTGWKINQPVADILLASWDDNLPEVPEKPSKGDKAKVADTLAALKKSDTARTRASYNKACEEWNDMLLYLSAISKRSDLNIIKKKILALKDVPEFFQYVDFDTRGRVYYQEHSLNFQGSDWARGVMQFSKGQRLNSEGVRWLAIHTANCFNIKFCRDKMPEYFEYDYKSYMEENGLENISLDKLTLDDRVTWVWENMYDVILPSRKILHERAEKPVSFLACCIEWHGVLFNKDHISYLPLPIDGSNNGYQHSGAIARDERTAGYVGLSPSELPRDLYMVCAKKLMEKCPEFFSARPDFSMGQIRKAIAKRGTMTRAYSAGAITMAENMYKDCHKEGYTKRYNISMLDCEMLAKELYALIGEVCPGATKTMDYLQDLVMFELGEFAHFDTTSGKKISKTKRKKLMLRRKKLNKISPMEITKEELKELNEIHKSLEDIECRLVRGNGKTSVNWVTPMRFPAESNYKIQNSMKILSFIPGFSGGKVSQPGRIRHVIKVDTNFPDRTKHTSAISPNYIHSLDSAHLLYTVHEWGGQFGAVHDSFSVHPNDVEELLQIAKDTFTNLYAADDIYVDIANDILSDGEGFDLDIPEYGSYDINELQESDYFFC